MKKTDISILRELAKKKKDACFEQKNADNIRLWTAVNDLKMIKPTVYINEFPWNEMNGTGELNPLCEDDFCKEIEIKLRRELFCVEHFEDNTVISDYIECPIEFYDSGFGFDEDVDIVKTDVDNEVVSRHFNIQIRSEEDIAKITSPVIALDEAKTAARFELLSDIFADTIEVKKVGVKGYWFTPWDNLIRLTGVEETMMDFFDRPEYVEQLVKRFLQVSIERLKKFNELGLWGSNNNNTRVGSGGYGYTNNLPFDGNLLTNALPGQIWGCSNAQIFSEVSPSMHWEFSLKYEIEWLKEFSLNYYGCCEPLHHKFDILRKIPNLRKISISPWAKIDIANEQSNKQFVLSIKPNPAIFATTNFDEDFARKEIKNILQKAKDSSFEIIMKDISTVKYDPSRLSHWSKIVNEEIKNIYE